MAVTILAGDCVETMRSLPAGTFQTCVTSPPYYGLRDYGVAGQIGLEPTPDEYIARMVEVFGEVRRVLRDDGTAWVNIGDSYNSATKGSSGATAKQATNAGAFFAPRKFNGGDAKEKDLLGIPWALAFALRADGWFLRSAIVWAKPNPMPESVRDRPTSAYEHVFLLSKRAAYFYDAEAIAEDALHSDMAASRNIVRSGAKSAENRAATLRRDGDVLGQSYVTRNARNVWTIATQPYSGAHFATMPPGLAERCIKAGTSERGQCPHCGAPWGRVTERGESDYARLGKANGADFARGDSQPGNKGNTRLPNGTVPSLRAAPVLRQGWAPSCDCPEHAPVPQHVLDPFGGAGTTGLVADRLGRHATLCELNPEYARLARERITADAPLLAAIAGAAA